MIKFENTEVFNFEGALRGMRNPLNSWAKSDSIFNAGFDSSGFIFGANDLDLAKRLIKAGSDHRKFLRQIFVSVDITAPLYWWKEFDTYKVATVANSCSTMHTIHVKEFTLDDFSHEDLILPRQLEVVIDMLNEYRRLYLKGFTGVPGDDAHNIAPKDKRIWRQMIQLLPSSYNQRRTVTLNYETLRNISGARRNHKLSEWSVGFMEWIDTLPYAEELIKS